MYNFLNVYKDLILTNISFKILYYILHMHDSIQMYCSHTLQKKKMPIFSHGFILKIKTCTIFQLIMTVVLIYQL